jgi:rubredoxin
LKILQCEGLELKQLLVRQFEEADLRTYQLCFAIKTQPKTGLQGSVILKKQAEGLYDILHTRDFNPNVKGEVIYKQSVKSADLSRHLIALCNEFYDIQSTDITVSVLPDENIIPQEKTTTYQCNCCLTRYDKAYGDPTNNIAAGIEFDTLTDYQCPVCEAPQSEFSLIE